MLLYIVKFILFFEDYLKILYGVRFIFIFFGIFIILSNLIICILKLFKGKFIYKINI